MRWETLIFTLFGVFLLWSQQAVAQNATAAVNTSSGGATDPSIFQALSGDASDDCFLTPEDFQYTDFATARTACDPTVLTSDAFCSSCILGVGTALVLGFDRAGIRINGQPISALTDAKSAPVLNELITNCSLVLGVQLLDSGALTSDALAALSECDVSSVDLSNVDQEVAVANSTTNPLASSKPTTNTSSGATMAGANATRTPAPAAVARSMGVMATMFSKHALLAGGLAAAMAVYL